MSSDLNNGSAVPETAEPNNSGSEGVGLSLRALHEALAQRGVEISYSGLSELVNTGDVAAQLHAGGAGNRRQFPALAADVLAAFLPAFKDSAAKKPQAPDLLRRFLAAPGSAVPETAELVKAGTGSDTWPPSVRGGSLAVRGTDEPADALAVAEAQGRAQGLAQSERVLTAAEAAEVLSVSVRQLRETVKPFRRFGRSARGDRWLLSDLLRPVEDRGILQQHVREGSP